MTRRAFTVVETLVAILLLVILAAAVGAFLWDLQSQRERMETLGEQRLAGALVIDRLEEAARYAYAADGRGSGIAGDATSLRIAYRRTSVETASPESTDLDPRRAVSIAWDESSGTLTLDDEPITDRVRRLVFRYYHEGAWVDAFDSAQAGGLPAAIEVAMWFGEALPSRDDRFMPEPVVLGAGVGMPTPAEFGTSDEPREWGEPDRRRVIAIPRLRHEGGA